MNSSLVQLDSGPAPTSPQAEPDPLDSRLQPLRGLAPGQLLVHEIYTSIQGESSFAGQPCRFIRTTACNLRCHYCDTRHAFRDGRTHTVESIAQQVQGGPKLVLITGGEPLLQPAVHPLMTRLCDLGFTVLIETSGSLDIAAVDSRVVRIVDFKTPSSGELGANLLSNIDHLRPRDEVKFVLGDRADYDWAVDFVRRHRLPQRCTVLMGPVHGSLAPRDLAAWVLEDQLPVRLQIQLHKVIWDPQTRGV